MCKNVGTVTVTQAYKKVQVGSDLEKAQSKEIPIPKTEAGKNEFSIRYVY